MVPATDPGRVTVMVMVAPEIVEATAQVTAPVMLEWALETALVMDLEPAIVVRN
jgi:hypothetical protein